MDRETVLEMILIVELAKDKEELGHIDLKKPIGDHTDIYDLVAKEWDRYKEYDRAVEDPDNLGFYWERVLEISYDVKRDEG